jgi:hypothetical protein
MAESDTARHHFRFHRVVVALGLGVRRRVRLAGVFIPVPRNPLPFIRFIEA